MPSNADFNLKILVGDTILPEYQKDGVTYVESNYFTPYSFKQQAEENVNGEIERQVQCTFHILGFEYYQHVVPGLLVFGFLIL